MKKKFAFLLMGSHYNPEEHQACFETANQITYIFTVKSFEEAYAKVSFLEKEGVGAIELCGAFGEERAQKMIELTHNKVAIGYVTHKPEQDHLFANFFSTFK
ncbi:DUF6506 family protein [Clostridium aminobutyricum]|uniref:Uncharacterized protein n=1 Tax=Clostridium aminobutyricum TaxID=33953 RepID=A0A939D5N8_CLOAM|nr:DUF6506 family protein [Clostridium aminobutyricum]MBN7771744.1 hypothetical protein [Clostridium aminobutyricum]